MRGPSPKAAQDDRLFGGPYRSANLEKQCDLTKFPSSPSCSLLPLRAASDPRQSADTLRRASRSWNSDSYLSTESSPADRVTDTAMRASMLCDLRLQSIQPLSTE